MSANSVSGAPAGITGSLGSEGSALRDSGTDGLRAGDSGESCTENDTEFDAPEAVTDSAAAAPDALPERSRVVAGRLPNAARSPCESLASNLRAARRPEVVSRAAPSPGVTFGRGAPPVDPS